MGEMICGSDAETRPLPQNIDNRVVLDLGMNNTNTQCSTKAFGLHNIPLQVQYLQLLGGTEVVGAQGLRYDFNHIR